MDAQQLQRLLNAIDEVRQQLGRVAFAIEHHVGGMKLTCRVCGSTIVHHASTKCPACRSTLGKGEADDVEDGSKAECPRAEGV